MNQRGYDDGFSVSQLPLGAEPLLWDEAMRLLASVDLGRVVFDMQALPTIRPVNHLVEDGIIIIRCRLTSALSAAVRSSDHVVVAYEADALDSRTRTGWSVIVTGRAQTLTDPGLIDHYERVLHPWVNHADTVVAIEPEIVTGLRLTGQTGRTGT